MIEEVPEDRSLAAHLSVAHPVPTADDLAADLAHRQSDASPSTAPTQVCLCCPLVLPHAVLCTIAVLCCAMPVLPCSNMSLGQHSLLI